MRITGDSVLVTGGAGAIGSNLVNRLIDLGCKVTVVDDLSSGFKFNLNKKAIFVNGSITSDKALKACFRTDIDMVFHLAANFANQNSVANPEKDLNVNGMGTVKLLEFSIRNNIKRFVYASSSCVYGTQNTKESSDDFSFSTPYAITKMLGERYVNYFGKMYGLKTTILRYFNSYGPGEFPGKYRNVIPNFIFLAMHNRPLPITGNGNETRDFTYVGDITKITLMASENKKAVGETFNLGTGKETKIIELARKINWMAGNASGIKIVDRRTWDHTKKRKAEISKMKKLIGCTPKTSLDRGLTMTLNWFKQNIHVIENAGKF